MKTEREWISEMHQLERMIVSSIYDEKRFIGWPGATLRAKCENQIEMIYVQLRAGRRNGVVGKAAIRGILGNARLATSQDALNFLQVELQNAIVSFSERDREERRCDVGLLFIQFVRSKAPVTDDLVDKLYWLLGSSFDDLDWGEGVQG